MPTYFAGLRTTNSYGADERPKDFREAILWLNPNGQAPLFALTSKAKTEAVTDPEYSWWEEVHNICRVKINNGGGYNSSATSLTVDDGANELIEGDLLMVEPTTQVAVYSPEVLRVTTAPSSDTVVVVARGQAGTTAASIADDAVLFRIGNAQAEGTRAPVSSSKNPTKFSNYTQIWKTPYEATGTDMSTRKRTGDTKSNEKVRKMFQHSEKIEQSLFWGLPSETIVSGKPLRTTRGIRSFITSYNTVFSIAPDEDAIINALAPIFDYDSGTAGNERIAWCGNACLTAMGQLVRDSGSQINYEGPVKEFGMEFRKYIFPFGTVYFKSHPLLNVHPVYRYSAFVMPGNGIIWRPLKGRDTKVWKNIQHNDEDTEKDMWMTEGGFEFHHERTWAYLGNVRRS